MNLFEAMLDELMRPSNASPGPLHGAYERAVIGIGHLVLGAAAAGILQPNPWLSLGLASTYFVTKEVADLRRGGTPRDGIEDAACVGLGLFYMGQWWAPSAALLIGAYLMWRGARAT